MLWLDLLSLFSNFGFCFSHYLRIGVHGVVGVTTGGFLLQYSRTSSFVPSDFYSGLLYEILPPQAEACSTCSN